MPPPKGHLLPAKFTDPKLLARIVKHARRGRSRTDCFRLAGIHPDTGFVWLRKAREGQLREGEEILIRFFRAFSRAQALFNAEQLEMIEGAAQSGAPNTWQAAGWLLERRDPENWGKRDRTVIEHENPPETKVNVLIVADEATREKSRDFLRSITGGDPSRIEDGSASVPVRARLRDESEDS